MERGRLVTWDYKTGVFNSKNISFWMKGQSLSLCLGEVVSEINVPQHWRQPLPESSRASEKEEDRVVRGVTGDFTGKVALDS